MSASQSLTRRQLHLASGSVQYLGYANDALSRPTNSDYTGANNADVDIVNTTRRYPINNNCIYGQSKKLHAENVNSLIKASVIHKFCPINELLPNNVFDVFSIQETQIDESFPITQFHVNM